MRPGQERIYYLIADSLEARAPARTWSCCKQKGIEVLLLADRIDEWVMGQVTEFEGKRFKDVARGDLELGGLADQAERARVDEERKENKALLKRFKDALGERVLEVRVSERLRESPACLVHGEGELSAQMRRVLAGCRPDRPAVAAGAGAERDASAGALLGGAERVRSVQRAGAAAVRRGRLMDEGQIGNPSDFSRRLNQLLVRLVQGPPSSSAQPAGAAPAN